MFADDTILYIENPKDTTRKLLELINEYSKFAGYKINMQKSLALLYTNNEKTGREIKETIPFKITWYMPSCWADTLDSRRIGVAGGSTTHGGQTAI